VDFIHSVALNCEFQINVMPCWLAIAVKEGDNQCWWCWMGGISVVLDMTTGGLVLRILMGIMQSVLKMVSLESV
jgi:hypothetical protein